MADKRIVEIHAYMRTGDSECGEIILSCMSDEKTTNNGYCPVKNLGYTRTR